MIDNKVEREPSIEDILASIRQIIASEKPTQPSQNEKRQGVLADYEDILDLTNLLPDEKQPARKVRHPASPQKGVSDKKTPVLDTEAVTKTVLNTMAQNLKATPSHKRHNPQTIEGLVEALLRPMIREWLDKNLAPLVKEIVAESMQDFTTPPASKRRLN